MKYFLFLLITVVVFSCKQSEEEDGLAPSKNLNYADSALAAQFIHKQIAGINRDTQIYIDTIPIFSRVILPRIYEKVNMIPIWMDSTNLHEAIDLLKNSVWDGLDPSDYHLQSILKYYELVQEQGTQDYEYLTKLDILLTDAIILYAYHLQDGKLDPVNFNPTWNNPNKNVPKNADELLLNALRDRKLKETVLAQRPNHIYYTGMMKSLQKYMGLQARGGWPVIAISPDSTVKIEPGDSHRLIPEIRNRLSIEGDFPAHHNVGQNVSKYDEKLVKAVKNFQTRHGILNDGVIGRNTIAHMNIPVHQKIIQIKLALERARWVLNNLEQDFILVNIPQFRLMLYEENERIWESKVIIGKEYTSTPVFTDSIKYIVFNPTWSLPNSIATNEILPRLKQDPSYLSQRRMNLYDLSGKKVDLSSVDFDTISTNDFPFYIQQRAGPGNALGRVKFMFPNKYSVYLHDTPSRHLFDNQDRAFSHGCIRLQDPFELAVILLNDEENWSMNDIEEVINSGRTIAVQVPHPYPILIQYWTHITSPDGTAYFFSDVYKRDVKLWQGLNASVYENYKRPEIYQ